MKRSYDGIIVRNERMDDHTFELNIILGKGEYTTQWNEVQWPNVESMGDGTYRFVDDESHIPSALIGSIITLTPIP